MITVNCRECKKEFSRNSNNIGAIYKESKSGLNVAYFVCIDCLDVDTHFHKLLMRSSWSHLYGDISGNDHDWMQYVTSRTKTTVCGKSGYASLNNKNKPNQGPYNE